MAQVAQLSEKKLAAPLAHFFSGTGMLSWVVHKVTTQDAQKKSHVLTVLFWFVTKFELETLHPCHAIFGWVLGWCQLADWLDIEWTKEGTPLFVGR
jgi:hypothetical protein